MPEPLPEHVQKIGTAVVDCAFKVHKALGPGLLESVYEACLVHELTKRGHAVRRQVTLPIIYDSVRIDDGLRLDLLVDDEIIIEIKAVERDAPVFLAQVMTYLKLADKRLGFLINFNVHTIKDGIRRVAL